MGGQSNSKKKTKTTEMSVASILSKYKYQEGEAGDEAEAESRELSLGQKYLREQEKNVSHHLAANRRIAEIRMARFLEYLHEAASCVDTEKHLVTEYPYLSTEVNDTAYSLVLACCLALGDERITARLFVQPHNLRFGDSTFDPLRERLRPIAGVSNLRLGSKGLACVRKFLEKLRQAPSRLLLGYYENTMLEEAAARALASLAAQNHGARFLKDLRDPDTVIRAATKLGFKAALGSRFSIHTQSIHQTIWKLRTQSHTDFEPAASAHDILIADFDFTKAAIAIPVTTAATDTSIHYEWEKAHLVSSSQNTAPLHKKSQSKREHFLAAVESAELAATASERILQLKLDQFSRLEDLYAVSASLDIAAELRPTQRLRELEIDHASLISPRAIQNELHPLLDVGLSAYDAHTLAEFSVDYCHIVREAFFLYPEENYFLIDQLPETSTSTEALSRLYTPGSTGLKSGARLKHRLQSQLETRHTHSRLVALSNDPPLSFYALAACLLFLVHISLSSMIYGFTQKTMLIDLASPLEESTHDELSTLLHELRNAGDPRLITRYRRIKRRKKRSEQRRLRSVYRLRWLCLQCVSALFSVLAIILGFRKIVRSPPFDTNTQPFNLATAYAILRKRLGYPIYESKDIHFKRKKCLDTLTSWQRELSARVIQASIRRGAVSFYEALAVLQAHHTVPHDEPHTYLNLPESKDSTSPERTQHLTVYPISTALLDALEHLLAPAHCRRSFIAASKLIDEKDQTKSKPLPIYHNTYATIRQALENRMNWSFVEESDGSVTIVRPAYETPTIKPTHVLSQEDRTLHSLSASSVSNAEPADATSPNATRSHRVIPKAQPGDTNPARKPTPSTEIGVKAQHPSSRAASIVEAAANDARQRNVDLDDFETPVDIIGNIPDLSQSSGEATHRRTRRRRPD